MVRVILYLTIGMVVGVSVAPNEALITGEVMEYAVLNSTLIGVKPEQTVYRLTIKIFSSKTLEGKLNFAQGENLKVYSKKELSSDLFGKFIKGKVTYRGDERGGKYWIKEIQVILIPPKPD